MADVEKSLRDYLKKIAEEQNYKNPEITTNDLSSGGANYTSTLFTATIKEKNKEDLHLFAKVAAVGEKFRTDMARDFYAIEKFAYSKLWKSYAALEEKYKVPQEHRLQYPKFYGFDDSTPNQETMVLENLLKHDYEPFDRFKSFDWEYASAAVTECAKMHSLSLAFQKIEPEEFEKALSFVTVNWYDAGMGTMFSKAIKSALEAVQPQHKKSLDKFINRDMKEVFADFIGSVRATAIIHGDYRGSNLMHRVRKVSLVE